MKHVLHSYTLPEDAAASYRAGGMEVNVVGFLTAVRDGADLRRLEGFKGRTYFKVLSVDFHNKLTYGTVLIVF